MMNNSMRGSHNQSIQQKRTVDCEESAVVPYEVSKYSYYKAEGTQVNNGLKEKFEDQNFLMILDNVTGTITKTPLQSYRQVLKEKQETLHKLITEKEEIQKTSKLFFEVHQQVLDGVSFFDQLQSYVAPNGIEHALGDLPSSYENTFLIDQPKVRIQNILREFRDRQMFIWDIKLKKITASRWLEHAYHINSAGVEDLTPTDRFAAFTDKPLSVVGLHHKYSRLLYEVFIELHNVVGNMTEETIILGNYREFPKFNVLWKNIEGKNLTGQPSTGVNIIEFYRHVLSRVRNDVIGYETEFYKIPLEFLEYLSSYVSKQNIEEQRKEKMEIYTKRLQNFRSIVITGEVLEEKKEKEEELEKKNHAHLPIIKDLRLNMIHPFGKKNLSEVENISEEEKIVLKYGCRFSTDLVHQTFIKKTIDPMSKDIAGVIKEFFRLQKQKEKQLYGISKESFAKYYPELELIPAPSPSDSTKIPVKPIFGLNPRPTNPIQSVTILSPSAREMLTNVMVNPNYTDTSILSYCKLVQLAEQVEGVLDKKILKVKDKDGAPTTKTTYEIHQLLPLLFSKLVDRYKGKRSFEPKEYAEILLEIKLFRGLFFSMKNYMLSGVEKHMDYNMKGLLVQIDETQKMIGLIQKKIKNTEQIQLNVNGVRNLVQSKVRQLGSVGTTASQNFTAFKYYKVEAKYIEGIFSILKDTIDDEEDIERFYNRDIIVTLARKGIGVENELRKIMKEIGGSIFGSDPMIQREIIRDAVQSRETLDRMARDWKVLHDMNFLKESITSLARVKKIDFLQSKEFFERIGFSDVSKPTLRYMKEELPAFMENLSKNAMNERYAQRTGQKKQAEVIIPALTTLEPGIFLSFLNELLKSFQYKTIIEPLAYDLGDLGSLPHIEASVLDQEDMYSDDPVEQKYTSAPTVILDTYSSQIHQVTTSSDFMPTSTRDVVVEETRNEDLGKTIMAGEGVSNIVNLITKYGPIAQQWKQASTIEEKNRIQASFPPGVFDDLKKFQVI